jgi:hypothetical protein
MALLAGLIYLLAQGEAITLRAEESQPMTRDPITPPEGANVVYVLKAGQTAQVLRCEDVKRPVVLVRVNSGETGFVDYGGGSFVLERQRIGPKLLLLSPTRITFSCHGMFWNAAISR